MIDEANARQAPKRVYLETLGCAKNRVDSEIMLGALAQRGYVYTPNPQQAEVILVNTCAFLTAASAESIERLLELADFKAPRGHCEKLVCAGCLTARYGEELLQELPEIDALLGSSDFVELPNLLDELFAASEEEQRTKQRVVRLRERPHYEHRGHLERLASTPPHLVYLKIAEGCSNLCSFCNIPFLRGYFSSRPQEEIVTEAQHWLERGVREINLVSQDTSSYGVDRHDGANLAHLLRQLDALHGDFWLRIFYAYPNTFGEEAIAALAEGEHLLPYLDMPLQHIADGVLKAMNRRITERAIRDKLALLKQRVPQLSLRTTFISGFPGESEADVERLCAFVSEGWFEHVGVFTYSHEDNIRSARWGDPIPASVKHRRRRAIMAAQRAVVSKRNEARVGQRLRVLVEERVPVEGDSPSQPLLLQARAAFQGPEVDGVVYINEGQATAGQFHHAKITEAREQHLIGSLCA